MKTCEGVLTFQNLCPWKLFKDNAFGQSHGSVVNLLEVKPLTETNCPSRISHQLSIAPQSGTGTHEPLPATMWTGLIFIRSFPGVP